MKTITLVSLLLVFFSLSCKQSIDKKTKKTINAYMFKHLNDFKSYEPVEYGSIDSLFSDYTMDETYIHSNERYKRNLEVIDSLNKIFDWNKRYEIPPTTGDINLLVDITMFTKVTYPKIIDSLKRNYQSHFIGMGLIHTFRARNAFGGTRLCSWQFIFSPNFETVTSIIDLENTPPIVNYSKVENEKEKEEKEKKEMEIKYTKEKETHDMFFNNLYKEEDIIYLKRGVIGKIIEIGQGNKIDYTAKTKIKTRDLDINGRELKVEETTITVSYTLFADIKDIRKGSKIVIYTPYEKNNDKNKKPYEVSIIEVTFI